MPVSIVRPEGWREPRGYADGVLAPPGARLVFVAGQIAWDAEHRLVGGADFAAQFGQALSNVLAVVAAAGGAPGDLAQMTVFVTDADLYRRSTARLGELWRERVGRHWPAMALVEVAGLLEPGALVEIQAVAAVTDRC